MRKPRQRYDASDNGPLSDIHSHEVEGGQMIHQHPLRKDFYEEPHNHLIVLCGRKFDSGPMAALETP